MGMKTTEHPTLKSPEVSPPLEGEQALVRLRRIQRPTSKLTKNGKDSFLEVHFFNG